MADPRASQNAARLSEDIGDVLTAIRRMIADDDALSSARERVRVERTDLIQDSAGDFLARRYGSNAALARQMVEPATRPAPVEPAASAVPEFILRGKPEVVPAANTAPLRLEAERRIEEPEAPKVSGWRAWLRPEPRDPAPAPAPVAPAAVAPAPAPVNAAPVVADGGDDDDFADAFDWKARMRPELDEPAPAAAVKAVEHRLSGWALPPEVGPDTVAQLAAEAEAFDVEMQAHAAVEDDANQVIRDLLREMVQEELNGELGERFSANLRAVIRREVAAAIEAQLDRF